MWASASAPKLGLTRALARGSLPCRFAHVNVSVPTMGESITEGTIQGWKKNVGDSVEVDELVAVIDTDKISVEVNAPVSGKLSKIEAQQGDVVYVGNTLFAINQDEETSISSGSENGAGIVNFAPQVPESQQNTQVNEGVSKQKINSVDWAGRKEKRIPLSRMRLRIAERLKQAQNEGVLLTTFQECDMTAVMKMRRQLGKEYLEKYGVKLGMDIIFVYFLLAGFNSFFLAASAKALQKWPGVNSAIEGKDLVERNFVDISVAVATPTGLMVPVIRDVDKKGLMDLEVELASLAKKAREARLSLEEMTGGTFTISNGGIYGSMMGTPIINPPQSAILGMHSIQDRPVVKNGEIIIRPIMYLALTYDHRIIDGREAVSFLKDVSNLIESPSSLLIKVNS
eukprot:Gregarina_sp_Poly_1__6095@NODE_3215_length_1266_cov_437_698082_g2043_i0_p1_GENE_NODE_3215_length_1266_cov_437_698082_g2043_i0NODE_3215_length_1266_cov_437_698082_g2043_i0_p1_ORF_typecomplete_len398_score44_182oxoacid_dh/PF00198_23/4_2e81Biotin_lipoyl/PF00364_22/6_2e19Biotin_lipoyl_2/PF13533_6/4Biotin_lipoyl_2/PF13533_6/0_00039HlyD_D23/PF16576_5/18HlyD_D23/PF16576_5/0_0015HlyD_3/PF13437_6/45HlyD_3/PF13437_6/0_0067RnfC_N/PF13375_6/0_00049RnfC_N/PF13375_6/1_8e04GCV_H/PF01597_19/0_036GCV_H/PF01597_1